ncbi:MAG: biliverdin-producing heme oxygenase [Pseudomonadota bacterium]
MTRNSDGAIRKRLADDTRAAHEGLHVHLLLAQLTRPSLEPETYLACLRANLGFYSGLEAARQASGLLSAFHLRREEDALLEDLGTDTRKPGIPFDYQDDPDFMAGALYVAHGAQFGRKLIAKSVKHSNPNAPVSFFALPADRAVWRQLLQKMERSGQTPERYTRLLAGANTAFDLMRCCADAQAAGCAQLALPA